MNGETHMKWAVYAGTFIHSLSRSKPLEVIECGLIGVCGGKIAFVEADHTRKQSLQSTWKFEDKDIVTLKENEVLIPGFIDTHIHAPQYPNSGLGLDLPLLKWLEKYTFPLEAKYKNLEFSKIAYRKVVERTLKNGTTCACYFATLDTRSSLILCDICETVGQKAFVGKVSMNRMAPEYYVETTEQAIVDSIAFVEEALSKKYSHVKPIITPRFTITCDPHLLKHLGDLAKKHDLHVQTHISENKDEINLVNELEPSSCHYADTYDVPGLIHQKVLSGGIFLSHFTLGKIGWRKDCAKTHPYWNE